MQVFLVSFRIIFPILFYMAVGLLVRRTKLLSDEAFTQINRLVFRVFLPIKLFLEIYESDFSSAFQPGLIVFGLVSVLIIYAGTWWIVSRFEKDRRNAPTMIQTIYRSNYVLFGMSIAESMYPDTNISVISVMAAFIVPLFNILAVILFEVYRGGEKLSVRHLLKGIAKNSLVIGSVLGLLTHGLHIELPEMVAEPLADLGAIATPLAILCVGATLSFGALQKYRRELFWVTFGRLVLVPAVFVGIAVLLGVKGVELAALFLIYAAPTANSSYPMAKELGGNGELAGLGIAVNNVVCLFTLFLWIALLKYFALC